MAESNTIEVTIMVTDDPNEAADDRAGERRRLR